MEFIFKRIRLFILFVLENSTVTVECANTMATLSLPTRLQHLTINKLNGRVIVGASNYIYILDSDLKLQQNVSTGPHMDNIRCWIPPAACSLKRVTQNVNKILAIDYSQNKLVTCGSIFQGTCELRNLADISQKVEYRQGGDYYVAANDPEASTVAFIAPGPNAITNALYVGGTYTGTANTKFIRNNVPAVSTRTLTGDPFKFVAENEFRIGAGSYMYTDSDARMPYEINYVTGFSYGGYSYFFTTQSESYNNDNKVASNTITSRIVRVCHTDPNYYSYIEIPIECTSNGEKYNILKAATLTNPGQDLATSMSISPNQDILVAAFVKGQSIPGQPNSKPSNESAICVYSMEAIRDKITDNGNRCFLHSSSTNATYLLGGSKTCVAVTGGYGPSGSCGQGFGRFDDNSPIVGSIPMTGNCLWKSTSVQLTSILTTTVDRHTIAYVGTSTGHIKKIHIQSQTTAAEYADVILDSNSAVQQDMLFESGKQAFYVMTQKKIQKMKVQECSSLTTCAECINAQDPHCGWCSLENKCSLKSECQNVDTPQRWLSDNVAHCPRFTKVTPENISRGTTATLELSISLLTPGPTYTCVFGDSLVTPAETTAFGLRCLTPDPRLLPYTSNADSTALLLSVNSSEAGVLFLVQNFTFFSCGYHTTRGCSSCVSSSWSCNWCLFDNTCTHNTAACQPGVITGTNVNLPGGRGQGAGSCPQLLPPSTQILLPNGSPKVITLQAKNLPVPMNGQSGYVCKITVDLTQVTVPTTFRNSSMVICDAQAYTYEGLIVNKKAKISLVWNDNFIVDNLHQVEATIYKCSVLGSECGVCLSLQDTYPEYQCGWCDKSCKYRGACQQSPFGACPSLQLSLVTPLNSPIDGGTRLTITGQDLGSSVQNVNNAVTVAGIPCTVIESEYEISRKIVCITGVTDVAKTGPVRVVIEGISSKWPQSFEYKNPQISTFEPFRGPMSGGTRITIKGTHLDTGTDRTVQLDLMDCEIDRNSIAPNATVCVTSLVDNPRTVQRLSMKFDKAIRQYYSSFYFTEDPTIKDITPLTAFLSGGRIVTVTGTNFQSIQKPLMLIKKGTVKSKKTECTVIDDTAMHCPTPEAPEAIMQSVQMMKYKRATPPRDESVISFIMDNVTAVQDLERYFPNITASMSYVTDPEYFEFEETDGVKLLKEDSLILEGENLNLACTEEEVIVKIGNDFCNVTSLAGTQLVCTAPKEQPEGIGYDGRLSRDALPLVTVCVGNLKFKLGKLKFYQYALSTEIIVGIAIGAGVLVCIIVVILIIYRRKSHKAQRDYKKMQIQLDTLESNVRNECKLAFAELQTDMGDLTSDLVETGIPFLEYDTYIFKVLFPQHADHPTLHELNDNNKGVIQGMDLFEQLILNKHFLVMVIRTLEQQKTFGVKDKANVASLLMIALLNKMEYATEILRVLLGELIDKSVEKKHPKLMLRRTESVVEKLLTNWLSICMYSYIQEYSGNALFILFKSIKYQAEKGPVDMITGDARYSLSEDRLLREKIEPKSLNINIILDNDEFIPCKVLDCDAISQVKEKMLDALYKNTAYSQRPNYQDCELEWRHGRSGHLTLADDDLTTEVEDGWKKVNTLHHYGVSDGAIMALVPKQHNGSPRNTNGDLYFETRLGSISSYTPFMNDTENGAKVWHLVKCDDMPQKERHKAISEIFLTRLLSTKGTLQKFVDDLFQTILAVNSMMPPAVKYLFDFLDESAKQHDITDPEVVYTWKSNSLPLRFWVNILKNPDFVFDIRRSHIVDSCLSVIAQTFMDSCSTSEHRLGKDSPTNKLLFAKDIPSYRKYVESFYSGIQELPSMSEQEINSAMVEISRKAPEGLHRPAALKELYSYVSKYQNEIMEALEEDSNSINLQLPQKLERVGVAVHGPVRL